MLTRDNLWKTTLKYRNLFSLTSKILILICEFLLFCLLDRHHEADVNIINLREYEHHSQTNININLNSNWYERNTSFPLGEQHAGQLASKKKVNKIEQSSKQTNKFGKKDYTVCCGICTNKVKFNKNTLPKS